MLVACGGQYTYPVKGGGEGWFVVGAWVGHLSLSVRKMDVGR